MTSIRRRRRLAQQVAGILETAGLIVGFGAQPIELGNKLDINSVDEATRRRRSTR